MTTPSDALAQAADLLAQFDWQGATDRAKRATSMNDFLRACDLGIEGVAVDGCGPEEMAALGRVYAAAAEFVAAGRDAAELARRKGIAT